MVKPLTIHFIHFSQTGVNIFTFFLPDARHDTKRCKKKSMQSCTNNVYKTARPRKGNWPLQKRKSKFTIYYIYVLESILTNLKDSSFTKHQPDIVIMITLCFQCLSPCCTTVWPLKIELGLALWFCWQNHLAVFTGNKLRGCSGHHRVNVTHHQLCLWELNPCS